MIVGTSLWILGPAFMPVSAQQSDIDLEILDCRIAEVTSDSLLVEFDVAAHVFSDDSLHVVFPTRIFFDGELWTDEHDHVLIIHGTVPCVTEPCQDDPSWGFCRAKLWLWKNGHMVDHTHCAIDANGDCTCPPLGRPVPHPKRGPKPAGSGLFEFILDPDNVVPETDESNNHCSFPFGATPIEKRTWGVLKSLHQ
jgi:hypothetical protein